MACPTLLLLGAGVFAQTPAPPNDELEGLFSHTGRDTASLNRYVDLVRSAGKADLGAALAYGPTAVHLADSLGWRNGQRKVRQILARAYWSTGDFDRALQYDMEVLQAMTGTKDQRALAVQLRRVGQDHLDGGNIADAHHYLGRSLEILWQLNDSSGLASMHGLFAYLHELEGDPAASAKSTHQALAIYEALGNDHGVSMSTANLARTYQTLDRLDEALEFYLRALRTSKAQTAADSINLASAHSELGDLYLRMGEPVKAHQQYDLALGIGTKIKDRAQIAMANRGFGAIALQEKRYALALQHLRIAAAQFQASGFLKIEEARTHTDIGYCQAHLGELDSAAASFNRVRSIAEGMNSPVILAGHFKGMEFLDSLRGDWEGAYRNGNRYHAIQDSIAGRASREQVVRTQLRYEEEKRELERRTLQDQLDTRQRTIRNSIAAVLAGALIFLVVVYRQRNRISKEKQRSEKLLLNILPEEVAKELKAKGSAEAVHLDSVTVLFTDFKGFTAMSEVVTPRQLVHDLHECFSAFDRIAEKHGIEKIKTIGDAYMAAGGLPTPNNTHALDVIKAAFEMRDFIAEGKARKIAGGLPYFEIRIGIHTGPVVAGIVGVKKFQYDIWGDTVNTASRMESSGEVGQVNISEATYALVKNETGLTLTPRGKVEAKGKGEMEMYFVS